MNTDRHPYVLNLPEWELQRMDDLEYTLAEELVARVRWIEVSSESLADAFHEVLHDRPRRLAETAVNEVIECRLRGLGDEKKWPLAGALGRAPLSRAG